jgi:hypothetical protein
MHIASLLFANWFLWLRGVLVSGAIFFLCRRRSYVAIVFALLAAYWAYDSISLMIRFRTQMLQQLGLSYAVQAYAALLMPFVFLGFGLLLPRKKNAEAGAPPNGGPTTPSGNSGVSGGPPSVS